MKWYMYKKKYEDMFSPATSFPFLTVWLQGSHENLLQLVLKLILVISHRQLGIVLLFYYILFFPSLTCIV